MDSKIVQVALNGLENILRLGEQEAKQENNGTGVNPYCSLIEEAYGNVHYVHTNVLKVSNNALIYWIHIQMLSVICKIFYIG